MHEADLRVGGVGDPDAQPRDVVGLVLADAQTQAGGVDDNEAVAAEGRIDREGAQPLDLDRRPEPGRERWQVPHRDPFGLAVPALRPDRDQPPRRLERQFGDRFGHRQDAAVEQDRRDADRVRPRHRRRVLGLHDQEGGIGARILGRNQKVHMAEHAAARLVQHELPQRLVRGEEVALGPKRVAGRRPDAAHDDVADLALGVGRDDVDGPAAAHVS
jgi:hypothetical protein